MATTIKFSVRKDENAQQHNVEVDFVTFDEATDAQRRKMWAEGIDGVTIKVQGTLRRALKKDGTLRGATLNARAQQAWTDVMNGTRSEVVREVKIMDCTVLLPTWDLTTEDGIKAARTQVDTLTAAGYTVKNIPAELVK